MKVKIYTDSLDYLSSNLLVMPFFPENLPLKGHLGFVDWRLNGFISGLFAQNKVKKEEYEKILVPPFGRIPSDRLLMFCLGPMAEIDARKIGLFTERLMETVHKIKLFSFAFAFPVEIETLNFAPDLVEAFFKGVDRFAVKTGPCEFLNNLRITFAIDKAKNPQTVETLSKYLSSRSIASQALVNA